MSLISKFSWDSNSLVLPWNGTATTKRKTSLRKRPQHILAVMCTYLLAGSPLFAETINVPGEYPTIQQAIAAASGGDIIEVAAGTYPERINTNGKAITVRGQIASDGVPISIIDGSNEGTVVTINNGENFDTVLENLVIQNGTVLSEGGGALVAFNSLATFNNCHFLNNTAARGGGAFVWQGADFTDCTFIGNSSTWNFPYNGSAIARSDVMGWPMTMDNCTVTGNTAADPTSWAVFAYYSKTAMVSNSTVCGNDSYECNICSGATNYVNDECEIECEPTSYAISANSNLTVTEQANRCACEKEWGSCGSWDGQWAVAYDLSQGVTAGREVTISCVSYGAFNDGGQTNGNIQLWRDTNGGAPTLPNDDLELLGTGNITIIGLEQEVIFDPPIVIPADTNLVVTMHAGWSDGYLSVGGNNSPSASQTWYRDYQGFCSNTFTDVSVLGYPNFAWVTELAIELSATPCPADFNNDGIVDGADLGVLISSWGPCSPPPASCVADITGNGIVEGGDLGLLIASWGQCPK